METEGVELSIPLGHYATVPQAELYPIQECAQLEAFRGRRARDIILCSDSQGAISALVNPKITSKLVLECITALETLAERHNVKLI